MPKLSELKLSDDQRVIQGAMTDRRLKPVKNFRFTELRVCCYCDFYHEALDVCERPDGPVFKDGLDEGPLALFSVCDRWKRTTLYDDEEENSRES